MEVTDRRTKTDFAEVIRKLVDEHFPEAERIVLVMDNLNTHKPASLYEAFSAAEARRLIEKLAIHYMPKHGSWLDMAENGVEHPGQTVPEPPHPRHESPYAGGRGLESDSQCRAGDNQLAIHNQPGRR